MCLNISPENKKKNLKEKYWPAHWQWNLHAPSKGESQNNLCARLPEKWKHMYVQLFIIWNLLRSSSIWLHVCMLTVATVANLHMHTFILDCPVCAMVRVQFSSLEPTGTQPFLPYLIKLGIIFDTGYFTCFLCPNLVYYVVIVFNPLHSPELVL